MALLAVVVVSIALAGIAYLGILGFRKYKAWANAKFEKLANRIRAISNGPDKNDIIVYGIYGFLNVSVEWQVPVNYSKENVEELLVLSSKFQTLSVKLCCMSLHPVGVFLAILNGVKTRKALHHFKSGTC